MKEAVVQRLMNGKRATIWDYPEIGKGLMDGSRLGPRPSIVELLKRPPRKIVSRAAVEVLGQLMTKLGLDDPPENSIVSIQVRSVDTSPHVKQDGNTLKGLVDRRWLKAQKANDADVDLEN